MGRVSARGTRFPAGVGNNRPTLYTFGRPSESPLWSAPHGALFRTGARNEIHSVRCAPELPSVANNPELDLAACRFTAALSADAARSAELVGARGERDMP